MRRYNLEKDYIDKFNRVARLDKDKDIKFFQCIGDKIIDEDKVKEINEERNRFQ